MLLLKEDTPSCLRHLHRVNDTFAPSGDEFTAITVADNIAVSSWEMGGLGLSAARGQDLVKAIHDTVGFLNQKKDAMRQREGEHQSVWKEVKHFMLPLIHVEPWQKAHRCYSGSMGCLEGEK